MDADEIARAFVTGHRRRYGQASRRSWMFCTCDPSIELHGSDDHLAFVDNDWMIEADATFDAHLATVLAPLVEQARQEGAREALSAAGRRMERLRDPNPINGDGSNHRLTRALDIVIDVAGDARDGVRDEVLDERAQMQAERDAYYLRMLAENRDRAERAATPGSGTAGGGT